MKLVRKRQQEDLARAKKHDPEFPYYFDDEAADWAVEFFSYLRFFEGEWAGKPFVLADWQEWDIVRPLFGWKKEGSGLRRFRRADVIVPKKNGKTPLAAGIGALMMLGDKEFGGRVICGATKEQQAREVWNAARKMIAASPELRGEVKAFRSSLYNESLGSSFMPIGRDSETSDGPSVHCGILDETHAHKDRSVFDIIDNALGARRQPMVLSISTLGVTGQSPVWASLDYGKKILERVLNNEEQFFFFASVDNPERWDDPVEWQKANPNLGISIYADGFQSDFAAVKDFPSKQNLFKCKRLNIPVSQATKWISLEAWDECGGELPLAFLKGKPCFCGLDLGIIRDLSAFVAAFRVGEITVGAETRPLVHVLAKFWIPEVGIMERWQKDRVDYPQWRELGFLTATPGETTRNDIIRQEINEFAREYDVQELALDKTHGHELMVQLSDDGLKVVDHSQSMHAMTEPCRHIETLIADRRLRHGANPILRWMASNVVVLRGADDKMKIAKDLSTERVDGVVATAMAIGRLMVNRNEEFVYNSRSVYIA